MNIKLSPVQVQKQLLTPFMQQSMAILVLPIADLNLTIEEELQNNPLLETKAESDTPIDHQEKHHQLRIEHHQEISNLISALDENFTDDEDREFQPIIQKETLETRLLSQLRCELSDPQKLNIGELIIGNLDDDGYLRISIEELASLAQTKDFSLIEEVLAIIRHLDPVGVASRNIAECLTTQLQIKLNGQSQLACEIVDKHLENVAERKYHKIAKALNTSVPTVETLCQIISTLNPKPARSHHPILVDSYIKPDVSIISDTESGGYQVLINRNGLPDLQVNSTYRNLLSQEGLTSQEKKYIKEKLRNALDFIKGIEHRGQTIALITNFIIDKQKEFLDTGHPNITPMRLKDVAVALGRNESTISRAVNNKYVETPHGLLPLKFFFSQALNNGDEASAAVSSRSVQEEVKTLVEQEDKKCPLSDLEIQKYFTQKGISLARRTINKYRKVLKIPTSSQRKQK